MTKRFRLALPRPFPRAWCFSFMTVVLSSTLATRAQAFCRTTTCDPNRDDCEIRDGCVRTGVPLVWKSLPIVYRFHSAGSQKLDDRPMRQAVRRAFDAWQNVECSRGRTSLRFEEGEDIELGKSLGAEEAKDKFGIFFRDEEWPHDNENESLALTNQKYGTVTGTIDYADIEINTANTVFRLTDVDEGDADLQAVMTHEVGHYIGFAHSPDEDAIMVAAYCQGSKRCQKGGSVDESRELGDDDIKAVCSTYPPADDRAPAPEASCAQAPGSTFSSWLVVSCGSVLATAIGRRLRRRGRGV